MDRYKKRLASQLCAAVNDEDARSVQHLLSKGASPDTVVDSRGVAAIHLAVGKETEKNLRCLKMLLQHGANPNTRSSEGMTALHIAAVWGCYQNLKLLLIHGGNPDAEDHEGNTPGQLAEQQDNRKCAHLLQEYQTSCADTEEDEFPKFQYSVYSDQTDTSSYPESDCSLTSQSSMISDFGEAPFSSTRRSSFFNLSNNNGIPNCRQISFNRLSGPSVLSSTRVSAVEPAATMPVLKEDVFCNDKDIFTTNANEHTPKAEGTIFSPRQYTVPAFYSRQGSRKSVSFRGVDEYVPVFSPESPSQHLAGDNQGISSLPFNMSEYSDFLNSERMATILPKQGIDVTSPDHVYVFCRESSKGTEEDLEKTVVSHALEVSDDEPEEENVKVPQIKTAEQQAHSRVGSSSSGTSSSCYSSCESDHYTSALDVSTNSGHRLLPAVDEVSPETESDEKTQVSTDSDHKFTKQDENLPPLRAEPDIGSRPETEPLPAMLDKLNLSEKRDVFEACNGSDVNTSSKNNLYEQVRSDATGTLEENCELSFTPSPFVTGRTRSRLSRCSLRTCITPQSPLAISSLFDETLPTPVRILRQTPRTQSSGYCYNSPQVPCYTPSYSERGKGGDSVSMDSQETQTSTLRATSSVSNSQADTLILSKNLSDSASESFSDTVLLEKSKDDSVNAYERNLAEIILAIQQKREGAELTDDLTSTDDASAKGEVNDAPAKDQISSLNSDDVWVTEDCSSQSESASSSSTSSCFSPRRSREDSDPPCTPGTGCTPRYSISRLSVSRRPQRLADLSYTPGGRPLIQDLDEPVEYLYTDTEQGHKLIETHVPSTTDTSLTSGMSTTSSEETILYDWRCLQTEMKDNKKHENKKTQMVAEVEKNGNSGDILLQETRGVTDKELRLKLLELGESPGPINSRTRPTYMRKLCRLLQESNSQPQIDQKQLEQPQKVKLGYSPELCCILQTFKLPDCQADEQALCQQFDQPDQTRKWREGIIKSSFNYLLLDPRVTKNLPFRSHTMTPHECFQTFIHAIFYVGKGKRSRPYSHLYEALEYYNGDKTAKRLCPKVQHILQVWNASQGVVSLHCFQNVIPVEAYTREACMVEAIGLKMLTNQKRGDYYGVVSSWQQKRKRELGIHLLYRAMQIFLAEGERQLRPADIR